MLTKQDIYLAYKKLKQEVYYDKNDLYLRFKLAEFECRQGFSNWTNILKILEPSSDFTANIDTTLSKYLKRIKSISIPKSYTATPENEPDKPKYLTNINVFDKYTVDKINYHIDAPIELHIISTLWCMYVGVLLDEKLSENCYGYRLHPNLHDDTDMSGNLFKYYPEQYSAWRDSGIEKAKTLLADREDVAILGLDISQFYYSIEFNFKDLREAISERLQTAEYNQQHCELVYILTDIVEQICLTYNNKLKSKLKLTHPYASEMTLPLGMNFSPILANWYIRDFDRAIEQEIKPAYYGRYVDDMLIVLVNPIIDKDEPVENFIARYFIKTSILQKGKDGNYGFARYNNLFIQKKKLILQYFAKNHSQASLEKFVKKLNKNSSEFRYLPEDDIDEKFNEVAFDLLYKGSPNKLSSVIGITENKYELAKFLGCKISLLIHSRHKPDPKSNSDLIRFFSGKTGLEYFSLWERCLTYMLVSKSYTEAKRLVNNMITCIKRVRYEVDGLEESVISQTLRDFLFSHLFYSLFMPFSLKKTIPAEFTNTINKIIFKEDYNEIIKHIRKSNMLRHFHVSMPLLNYTTYDEDYTEFVDLNSNEYPLDKMKIKYSPRFIHVDEFLTYKLFEQLHKTSPKEKINDYYEVFRKYQPVEYDEISCELVKRYCGKTDDDVCPKDGSFWHIKVNPDGGKYKNKIKIGIVNLHVEYPDIENSFKRTPNISVQRRQQFNAILNLATREKCNLLILPELSVPFSWLQDMIYHSRNKQIGLILGLEYFVSQNGYAYNYLATILPYIDAKKRKCCFHNLRLKKHYAHKEIELLNGNRLRVPTGVDVIYDKYEWQGVHFSAFNCFELADIHHRSLFKSMIDLMVACEYNSDVAYFSNIAESVSRDIHCYFTQANSSDYGDSRIVSPSKKEFMDVVKVKGGENTTILTATLDLMALREHQFKRYSLQKESKVFKPTPPNYDVEELKKRM